MGPSQGGPRMLYRRPGLQMRNSDRTGAGLEGELKKGGK